MCSTLFYYIVVVCCSILYSNIFKYDWQLQNRDCKSYDLSSDFSGFQLPQVRLGCRAMAVLALARDRAVGSTNCRRKAQQISDRKCGRESSPKGQHLVRKQILGNLRGKIITVITDHFSAKTKGFYVQYPFWRSNTKVQQCLFKTPMGYRRCRPSTNLSWNLAPRDWHHHFCAAPIFTYIYIICMQYMYMDLFIYGYVVINCYY